MRVMRLKFMGREKVATMPAEWLWRNAKFSCVEGLLWLPVALGIGRVVVAGLPLGLWLGTLFVIRCFATLVCAKVQQRGWLALIGLALGLLAPLGLWQGHALSATPWLASAGGMVAAVIPLWAVGVASYWRSVQIARANRSDYPVSHYVGGLLTYLALDLLAKWHGRYLALLPAMNVVGVVCLGIALFQINTAVLGRVSLAETARPDVDASVLRRNRRYIGVLLAIILAVAVVPGLHQLVAGWLHRPVGHAPVNQTGTGVPPAPAGTAQPPRLQHAGQPSLFSRVLSVVLEVLGVIILLALAVVLALQAWKLARVVWAGLSRWVRGRTGVAVQSRDYTETVESLAPRRAGRVGKRLRHRRRGRSRVGAWPGNKSAVEKVRYLYRLVIGQSIREGFPWSVALTPSETAQALAAFRKRQGAAKVTAAGAGAETGAEIAEAKELQELAEAYGRVRYGGDTPPPEEVEALRRRWLERGAR